MRELVEPRRQNLDAPVRERAEVVHRRAQRLERRPPRLVRQRDRHLGAAGERAEQLPLGAGQVLEAVGEDGLAVPRAEVGLEALDRMPAQRVSIPAAQPVELRAVRGVEAGEVAVERGRVEQAGLELREGRGERLGEPGEARRAAEAVQRRAADDAADEQRALRVAEQRPGAARDPLEDVVERPDRAAEQCAGPREQVALDPFDVRAVRHDENRPAGKRSQIPLQQERHLARAGRPCDEAETHRSILGLGPDGP